MIAHPSYSLRLFLLCALLLPIFPATAIVVEGLVLDSQEEALEDAVVWLTQDRRVRKTTTDQAGHFHFDAVAVGETEIVAWKKGLSIAGYSAFLVRSLEHTFYLGATGSLAMRIIDQAFNPLEGVRLRSLTLDGHAVISVEDLIAHGFPANRSNKDGHFEIPWLPEAGFVKLALSHYRFADTYIAYLPIGRKSPDVMMHPGMKLNGQVVFEKKAIADARIVLFAMTLQGPREYTEVRSDPEGYFSLRAKKGEYRIAVRHRDYASPEPQGVLLQEDTPPEAITIALEDPLHIYGRVLFPDKRPCPGAKLIYRIGDTIFAETYTEQEGRFHIQIASPTGILAVIPPPGYLTESLSEIPVAMGEKKEAHLSDIHLQALPEIIGVAVDKEGAAVAGALVSSLDLVRPVWHITDAEGKFRIQLQRPPDESEQHFRIEHPTRFLRGEFKVNLRKSKENRVTLKPFEAKQKQLPAIPGRNNLDSLIGKEAPPITCQDWFNSPPLDLKALKNKVVVLFFWGGFDLSIYGESCLEEMRALSDLLKEVEDVRFIAIHDAGNEADEIEGFIHDRGIRFPVGRDNDLFTSFVSYGINFIPQTLLIDKKGMVRYYNTDGRILELIKVLRREG